MPKSNFNNQQSIQTSQLLPKLISVTIMANVAVLGAGISGLTAAFHLSRATTSGTVKRIIVLESSGRCGGWVRSTRHEDGTVFERGPRSLRGFGRGADNTLELVDELDLVDDMIVVPKDAPAAQNRFLYVDQQLHGLPRGLGSLFSKSALFPKPLI